MAIKLKDKNGADYAAFRSKIMRRFCGNALLSIILVIILYVLVWRRRGGNIIASCLTHLLGVDRETANWMYFRYFGSYREVFFAAAITLVFVLLLLRLFRWMTGYFKEIDLGINELLADNSEAISLSPEMLPFERKLNAVKQTLERQKSETALAEQRKDELVMYLAHDIRTPLTSVIGYLNLLDEEPNLPTEQRAKHIRITLEKAYRLEKMINEFFEITRYNSQHIKLKKVPIDLSYMLIQLSDELSPSFSQRGITTVLEIDEDLSICADADQLARVFSNILKNAAAYSYPNTEIRISAERTKGQVAVSFQNKGKTIPAEKLSSLFDKFYRLDESRASDTGGTGLGLAIAKEIVLLHGGIIQASSENDTITFTVRLPAADSENIYPISGFSQETIN